MVQKKKPKTFQYKQVFEPGNYLQNAAFQTPEIQQHIRTKSCAHDHTGFQFSEVDFALLSWALEEKELRFLIFCERKVWNCLKKNYHNIWHQDNQKPPAMSFQASNLLLQTDNP